MRRTYQIALIGLAGVALTCGMLAFNRLTPASNVTAISWQQDWPEFGGWSGLDVTDNGQQFSVISDGSALAHGTFTRTNGTLSGVQATFDRFIVTPDPFDPNNRRLRDAEGIALTRSGTLLVSFEQETRILRLAPDGRFLDAFEMSHDLLAIRDNTGLEALAIDDEGTVYALPERATDTLAVYRYRWGRWDIVTKLARGVGWRAVGADIGPDGRLYLLERRFFMGGFASQIRRFDLESPDPEGETLYKSALGTHGNLEGLAVWQDTAGRMRLVSVSDNNHFWFQRTEFVEIVIER
ncbi:MAG: hypothetical protein ACJA1E_001852 [Paracoccaceae bacterium]|jgi:hypothetical protein